MVLSVASVPNEFSKEEIGFYVNGIVKAFDKAFNISPEECKVFAVILPPEDYCEIQASKLSLNICMQEGKTDDQKDAFAMHYKEACDRAFGQKSLLAIATIDEHSSEQELHYNVLL